MDQLFVSDTFICVKLTAFISLACADLGIFVNEGEELEEQVAQDSLASRQPSVEYLAYAGTTASALA